MAAVIPRSCRTTVVGDAVLDIADDVRIGERCRFMCHERITIEAGAVLEEEVVLIDFDHRADDVETPTRLQGLITGPIHVGAGALLRKGCVVQRGITIGAGAEVGHHAVVTRDVPPGAFVEGVPARPAARSAG